MRLPCRSLEQEARRQRIREKLQALREEVKEVETEYRQRSSEAPDVDAVLEDEDLQADREALEARAKDLGRRIRTLEAGLEEADGLLRTELSRGMRWLGRELRDEYAAIAEEARPVVERLLEIAERERELRE